MDMTAASSTRAIRARHVLGVFAAASGLVVVGVAFYLTDLDPFIALAVLPLAAALIETGRRARRDGEWPARGWRYVLAAAASGLLIYVGELWIYAMAHPPVTV